MVGLGGPTYKHKGRVVQVFLCHMIARSSSVFKQANTKMKKPTAAPVMDWLILRYVSQSMRHFGRNPPRWVAGKKKCD
jgi:hypothetical protein